MFATLLLAAVLTGAPTPVSPIDYVPAGGAIRQPRIVANGDRALVLWSGGEGAVRLDADGKPLDVPAIALPKPEDASGADVAAEGDGWLVAWTRYQALRLVHISREGVVGTPRDLPFVESLPGFQFARGSSRFAAVGAQSEHVTLVSISDSSVTPLATIEGTFRAVVATAGGAALVLSDHVVRFSASGTQTATIALPGFLPTDALAIGEDVYVAGRANDSFAPAVIRVDDEATLIAQFASGTYDVRIDRSGDDLLLNWITQAGYDLAVARVRLDGSITGPQVLVRDASSTKWGAGLEVAGIACLGERCVMAWAEGFVTPSIAWYNLYNATFDAALQLGEPRIVAWRAPDQQLIGSATSGGITLVVWADPWGSLRSIRPVILARRFTPEGRPLDPAPLNLGELNPYAVRATNDGFIVLGMRLQARIGLQGAPVLDAPTPFLRDLACSATECLAAWIEGGSISPFSLRVSRFRDGHLLDPPGVLVHVTSQLYTAVSIVPSGDAFLVGFGQRPAPDAGHIESIARIRGSDIAISDFAASPRLAGGLRLIREGDHFLALWNESGGVRASRLSLEGHSLDGEETGWEGWRVEGIEYVDDVAFDGSRTLLISSGAAFELRGRTAVPLADIPGSARKIECAAEHRCFVITQQEVTGDPWYRATRLFLQTFSFLRPRAVRH